MIVLREVENGTQRVTVAPKKIADVTEYLKYQRRFRHVAGNDAILTEFRTFVKDQLASFGIEGKAEAREG